ncbi:hypothetical protein ACJROX_18210 [Pseudalkalibacillus sp. A8]|uniref:hypothetical protein n=1 Tax=Pseudalkalibacillus sp. A8 TaxID=3382641 RepID=UPI0038B648AD
MTLIVTMLQILLQEKVKDRLLGRVFASWGFIAILGGGLGAFNVGLIKVSCGMQKGTMILAFITILSFLTSSISIP